MEDISLHILDIAENSIVAGAGNVEIRIIENVPADSFVLTLKDDGRGMDEELLKKVRDPFFTTKMAGEQKKKFGLGIPFLAQAAEECDGMFSIDSLPGEGTTIRSEFRLSHIDRKPLGDVGATMAVLIGGHPEIDFLLVYERDGFLYAFDTRELKKELDGVPINLPDVLKLIKNDINEAIKGGP